MKKPETADLLADPEVQRHTQRILELQEAERRAHGELGRIIAAIGAELIAVKAALDRLAGKTAWLRWLKTHVHYSADTAQRYMRVARFTEKNRSAAVFFDLDPTLLYRIAALPEEIAATLTPDTPLTDPRTGRQTPLKDLSTRALDRALDSLEGKRAPAAPKPAAADAAFAGATREEFAADALRTMDTLSGRLAEIRGRKGRLTGDSKERVLTAIERLRRIVLKWPAWATPVAARRPGKRAARRAS